MVISNQPVFFSSGDRDQEVLISIMDDLDYEGPEDETFGVRLSLLSCFDMDRVSISIDASESIVAIQDNDPRPSESLSLIFFVICNYCSYPFYHP